MNEFFSQLWVNLYNQLQSKVSQESSNDFKMVNAGHQTLSFAKTTRKYVLSHVYIHLYVNGLYINSYINLYI